MKWLTLQLALLIVSGTAINFAAAGEYISFVACPVARDVGPDVDICFFAEHEGQRYALESPTDWPSAQLLHQVLVEGEVIDGPLVCGASQFSGRFSVLLEIDRNCNKLLPFDGSVIGEPFDLFSLLTDTDRERALRHQRLAEDKPERSLDPVMFDVPAPPTPIPPFEEKELIVVFPYNSDRGSGPDISELVNLVDYVKVSGARVKVTAFQGQAKLKNGTVMNEKSGMAEQRAKKMETILLGLGLEQSKLDVQWDNDNIPGDGEHDWKNRFVRFTAYF